MVVLPGTLWHAVPVCPLLDRQLTLSCSVCVFQWSRVFRAGLPQITREMKVSVSPATQHAELMLVDQVSLAGSLFSVQFPWFGQSRRFMVTLEFRQWSTDFINNKRCITSPAGSSTSICSDILIIEFVTFCDQNEISVLSSDKTGSVMMVRSG